MRLHRRLAILPSHAVNWRGQKTCALLGPTLMPRHAFQALKRSQPGAMKSRARSPRKALRRPEGPQPLRQPPERYRPQSCYRRATPQRPLAYPAGTCRGRGEAYALLSPVLLAQARPAATPRPAARLLPVGLSIGKRYNALGPACGWPLQACCPRQRWLAAACQPHPRRLSARGCRA